MYSKSVKFTEKGYTCIRVYNKKLNIYLKFISLILKSNRIAMKHLILRNKALRLEI